MAGHYALCALIFFHLTFTAIPKTCTVKGILSDEWETQGVEIVTGLLGVGKYTAKWQDPQPCAPKLEIEKLRFVDPMSQAKETYSKG